MYIKLILFFICIGVVFKCFWFFYKILIRKIMLKVKWIIMIKNIEIYLLWFVCLLVKDFKYFMYLVLKGKFIFK